MDKIYREKLTEMQYQVTRNGATERAFTSGCMTCILLKEIIIVCAAIIKLF